MSTRQDSHDHGSDGQCRWSSGGRSMEPPVGCGRTIFTASSASLLFDPGRPSWQPSMALYCTDLVRPRVEDRADAFLGGEKVDPGNRDINDFGTDRLDKPRPRLSTNAPPRITPIDRFSQPARNIAPKARIIKNVLVIGCSCMCSMGCLAPLRIYLILSLNLKIIAPFALAMIELCTAVSCFYGSAVARKLTYKLTIAVCQIPSAVILAAILYCHYYTILPAAVVLGLFAGPMWNAVVAYLINMAAQFAYLSYETQDKMVKRFFSTLNTLISCGWTWSHLVAAGAFNAMENGHNATELGKGTCGLAYCNRWDILELPNFGYDAKNPDASAEDVLPVYSITVYASSVIFAVALTLCLLDKLKVQLCSQTNKLTSTKQLVSQVAQIFVHQRIRLIIPMFIFIGLQETFIICDVTKAYVACTSARSTVGYVMFCYGMVITFMSAFLCAAIRHIRRVTILLAGLACHCWALVIMWMWKPASDDKPILYVIVAAFSIADGIWITLCQTMVYQCFPEQWEAPFSAYYASKSIGSAIGFLISPFGCLEYKIYLMALSSAVALLPFLIQELQAQKIDWLSPSASSSASDGT